MPLVIESFEEFAARHGGNSVAHGGELLFADGARADADTGTIRWEPPADPTELLRARRFYARRKLARAESDFQAAQSGFVALANNAARSPNVPGPPQDAAQILEALKSDAKKWRFDLEQIEEQLSNTPEALQRAQVQQQAGERRQEIAALAGEIANVSLD